MRSLLFFPLGMKLAPFSPFAPPSALASASDSVFAFASSSLMLLFLLLLLALPPLPLSLRSEQHAPSEAFSLERFINGDSSGQSDSSIRSLRSMPNEMRFGVSKMWRCGVEIQCVIRMRITVTVTDYDSTRAEHRILRFIVGLHF